MCLPGTSLSFSCLNICKPYQLAFTHAKLHSSADTRLGLNEYKCESQEGWLKDKSDQLYRLLEALIRLGAPVDHVGFQVRRKQASMKRSISIRTFT